MLTSVESSGQWSTVGNYAIDSEPDMQAFGRTLVEKLPRGTLVSLSGELGAGKSVLARAMIHALGYNGRVKSPTYTLIETYDVEGSSDEHRYRIAHMDLYRLADPEELDYLGFEDVSRQCDLMIIEWVEMGGDRVPEPQVRITIEYAENDSRMLILESTLDLKIT